MTQRQRGKSARHELGLRALKPALRAVVKAGRLTVIGAHATRLVIDSGAPGPSVAIKLHSAALPFKLLSRPSLALGEAYMDGSLTVEGGSIRDLLAIVTSGLDGLDELPIERLRAPLARIATRLTGNRRRKAARNVARHYDLSNEFYALFLDEDWQYSCAYFCQGCGSLDDAQTAKRSHIVQKLMVGEGMSVLDIGCGWGGLAIELAKQGAAEVLGISLSQEQLTLARQRAEEAGFAEEARFDFCDYRDLQGEFDRIVSVGMFEHVGPASYGSFFRAIEEHLAPDGVAVVHSIGRMAPPGGKDPWVDKYIFPGGYIPSLSETLSVVERMGLWVTDIEILRLHYAETLAHWYERFQSRREKALELFDERFCRMWEYYLAACEMMFRNGNLMVFQLQLAHKRDAVPLTREYLYAPRDQSAVPRDAGGNHLRCSCSARSRLLGTSNSEGVPPMRYDGSSTS